MTNTQPKIQRLGSIEEIDALLVGDLVFCWSFGRTTYLGSSSKNVHFFAKRTGEYLESITSIECERNKIHLGKASLVMDNPKITIVKKGDAQYDFLNTELSRVGQ